MKEITVKSFSEIPKEEDRKDTLVILDFEGEGEDLKNGYFRVSKGRFYANDHSTVYAYDHSTVYAYGQSTVSAYGQSTVSANGHSTVYANDQSTVYAYDQSTVSAYDHSTVYAYDQSTVSAYDHSTVSANGQSTVSAYNQSTVYAYDQSVVRIYSKITKIKKQEKTAVIIKVKPLKITTESWLKRFNIQRHTKDEYILFKRVSADFKTQENTSNETSWLIGSTVTVKTWEPKQKECKGGKFHGVAYPAYAMRFRKEPGDKFIALVIHKKDLYAWPNPIYPAKIGFREGRVLYECDIKGKKIEP